MTTSTARFDWLETQGIDFTAASVLHPLCGPGLIAAQLPPRGCRRYLGLDISWPAVVHARGLGLPRGYRFERTDVSTRIVVDEAAFAMVLLTYEAVNAFDPDELRTLLRSLRSVLEPGGTILAEVRLRSPCRHQPTTARAWVDISVLDDAPHELRIDRRCTADRGVHVVIERFRRRDHPTDDPSWLQSVVWEYSLAELSDIAEDADLTLARVLRPPPIETDHLDAGADIFVLLEPCGSW